MHIQFDQVARTPVPGDNAAIACQRLDIGTQITSDGTTYALSHTVLEGHRFAQVPINESAPLRSWGLPFGIATRAIEPGEYVCNAKMIEALAARGVDFDLPDSPNFVDWDEPYVLDTKTVRATSQVPPHSEPRYFEGYARKGRGVGTRNHIVILGTSSLAGTYVLAVADRFKDVPKHHPNIDRVVAVAHTEGGEEDPNNRQLVLRSLAGFMVHPNVGAVLVVDWGDEPIHNGLLRRFLSDNNYPLKDGDPIHQYISLGQMGSLQDAIVQGCAIIERWLPAVDGQVRSHQPVTHLKLALQCGGSDAFSGISGNPLAGWVAKEVVRCGGSANLAETDELMGAEPYVLSRVRNMAVAEAMLEKMQAFRARAAMHGHSAAGNPSGGNLYRGLYNIAIKSIGAARKKDPDVRLDAVIDYGQRMNDPGYYFMDSPGNDLESVAGQVASGANLILFTTGNGSITNFPFVPTIKIITTSARYNLIQNDMDVNAGRYQDGTPLEDLGTETFQLALRIASRERTLGEKAGHAQVQLWRNWHQRDRHDLERIQIAPKPAGKPLLTKGMIQDLPALLGRVGGGARSAPTFEAYRTPNGFAADQVGVVVPTSLCSGQIARMIVETMNERALHRDLVSRFVSFAHTEGCGVSSGDNEQLFLRTLIGHMTHPMVRCGLFLEHGCEKTHNDAIRNVVLEQDLDPRNFGWASVQLDGGIVKATGKVMAWFDQRLAEVGALHSETVGIEHLRLGILSVGTIIADVATALAQLCAAVLVRGGGVVIPRNASILSSESFVRRLLGSKKVETTLAYGQPARDRGFHVMDTPTEHPSETMTGLGATGVDLMLAHISQRPLQAHPMVPLIQVASEPVADVDRILNAGDPPEDMAHQLLGLVFDVASRRYTPQLFGHGYTTFQMTRGLLGVSL